MTALEIAMDPLSSHDELRRLVQSTEPGVRRAIACNPNIPRDVVVLLLRMFPFEIVANPGWQLLLLENPGFIEREVSHFAIAKMLNEQTLPEELVACFAQHPSEYIRRRVAEYRQRNHSG
jgi:hypothetical protein